MTRTSNGQKKNDKEQAMAKSKMTRTSNGQKKNDKNKQWPRNHYTNTNKWLSNTTVFETSVYLWCYGVVNIQLFLS